MVGGTKGELVDRIVAGVGEVPPAPGREVGAPFSATLDRSDHGMAASFGGGRPIHAVSGGLSEDMLFLGIGAVIRASDDLNLGLGYRSEWRGGNDRLNSGSISASFRF
jgi:hypothetical protein